MIEVLHSFAIVDFVLFGIVDGVVGHGQAFSKQTAELLAGMWLGDALCRSHWSFWYLEIG
jgi:hypothetical protein